MNTKIVRELHNSKLQTARTLILETFLQFIASEYTAEGVETFRHFLYDERLPENARFFGVFDGDLQGVLIYQPVRKHICAFFVRNGRQGHGYGGTLMRWFLENIAEPFVTVNASTYGVPVYERFGFTATDKKQCKDGISFTPMKRIGGE